MNKNKEVAKKVAQIKVEQTTTAALSAVLQAIKGAKIMTIVTETDPKLKKRGNPFEGVTKRTTMNVMANFNYRTALDKALVAKGEAPSNREKKARTWGERVPNSPFIMHKGALYLEVKLNGRPSKVEYLVDGEAIATDRVAQWIPVRKDAEVPMCDVQIANIKELRVNGVRYIVK